MRLRATVTAIIAGLLFLETMLLIPVGSAAPYAADQADGPYIGTWTSAAAAEAGQLDDLGVGWARVVAVWAAVEPADNAFSWTNLDAEVDAASGSGRRRVLVMIRNNPTWAAASRCKVSTDAERARLADFAAALVGRYKDRVKYWQLYNEMDNTREDIDQQYDLGGCFGTAAGATPTPAGRDAYALMLEAVGAAIHASDPAAKVVMGGVVSGNFLSPACPTCAFDGDFIKGVLASLKARGRLDRLDYVAVHYFSSQAGAYAAFGPDLLGRVARLRQEMREAGLSESEVKPILLDEGSYTGMIGASTADPNDPFNRAQRDYLTKALARAAAADVVAYFWFWLRDTSGGLGGDNAYGLLTGNGSKKPSFQAARYFQSLVDRRDRFLTRLIPANPKLEGYEFTTHDGRRLQIVWNETDTETVSYPLPFGTTGAITDPVGTQVGSGSPTAGIGAEPRFILSPGCTPRPNVGVSVVPAGAGRLQVTLAANVSEGVPNNRLIHLRFGDGTNMRIDVPGGPSGVPGNVDLDLPAVTATTFFIRRADASITSALLRLTVTDGCGAWQTFVGGGPTAWSGLATPQAGSPMPEPVICDPRPQVAVQTVQVGVGRLRTTVTASSKAGQPVNGLRSIQITRTDNATVDVPIQPGVERARTVLGTGQTIDVDPAQVTVELQVQRTTPGAFTVQLLASDGCGPTRPTFVGGGVGVP